MNRKWALLVVYLVGVVLTFGHEANRDMNDIRGSDTEKVGAFIAACYAAAWPIYWPLRLSDLAFSR